MKKYTLTTVQAGELVGKHHTTIARYVREGRLDAIELSVSVGRPKLRVNREDVLAIWEEKKERANKYRREKNKSQVRMKKTNSSKQISHKGEVWDVLNPEGVIAFTGTFSQCLKEKPGIETDAGQYHTMQMRGGQRERDHTTTKGHQFEQIDRYQFHMGD